MFLLNNFWTLVLLALLCSRNPAAGLKCYQDGKVQTCGPRDDICTILTGDPVFQGGCSNSIMCSGAKDETLSCETSPNICCCKADLCNSKEKIGKDNICRANPKTDFCKGWTDSGKGSGVSVSTASFGSTIILASIGAYISGSLIQS